MTDVDELFFVAAITFTPGTQSSLLNPRSCKLLNVLFPDLGDGAYWLTTGTTAFNTQTYCDMTGGGWTLFMKMGGATMCYTSTRWFDGQSYNPNSLIDTTYASGTDAKSALFDSMNDVQTIKLVNSRGSVSVSFVSASSPRQLMTSTAIPFSQYPDYTAWRAVFSQDRSSAPIFIRGGQADTGNYASFACPRTNANAGPIGCGQTCMFCFNAADHNGIGGGDGALNSCNVAVGGNDVSSGIGLMSGTVCGGDQPSCSYQGRWSSLATAVNVWATYDCARVGQCNSRGLCIAPNVCKCNAGFTGPTCATR